MDQASDVFKTNEDHELLTALKNAGFQGERDRIAELSVKFEEHSEQLQEVGSFGTFYGIISLVCILCLSSNVLSLCFISVFWLFYCYDFWTLINQCIIYYFCLFRCGLLKTGFVNAECVVLEFYSV